VDLAASVFGDHLHHAGLVHSLADFLLTMKALEEDRVALHLGMRDLDGNRAAGAQVRASKDRGHTAARRNAFDAVMIELITRMEWGHRRRRSGRKAAGAPGLAKLVGPPAVHAHALNASNADELHADIIAAVPLVRKRHQLACGRVQVKAVAHDAGYVRFGHGAVEAVRAKHQHVARKHLVIAGLDADKEITSK